MKIVLAAALGLLPVAAIGQSDKEVVYACQIHLSTGASFENGAWTQKKFNFDPPFFLKSVDGRLTIDSIRAGLDLGLDNNPPVCELMFDTETCSSAFGEAMTFNHSLHTGANTNMMGSTSSGESRNTVFLDLFTCQKM